MARKTIGFVPLIWECPYCQTQNPGPIKTCTSCGAPQPDEVEFLQVDEDKFNFIKDEALIRMAMSGPDIHCPYCGTRNPADAELCSNCGGEINIQGKVVRETGHEVKTVAESKQESPSPSTRKKPSRLVTILLSLGGLAIIAGCLIFLIMLLKTDSIEGTVTGVNWERSIAIEAFTNVTKDAWRDEIPNDTEIITCSQRYRYTSESPEANATEVCSEAVVEDTGTGIGEVVQECVYEVYDDYCEFTVMDWVVLTTLSETGTGLDPYWPEPNLSSDQRTGATTEDYTIVFTGDGERYTYSTSDVETFTMARVGSEWELSVNQLGAVQSIEPIY